MPLYSFQPALNVNSVNRASPVETLMREYIFLDRHRAMGDVNMMVKIFGDTLGAELDRMKTKTFHS
jgi:hypothetical protein